MSESEKKTYSAKQIFNKWLRYIYQDGYSRFTYKESQGHIEHLVSWFKDENIDYEDAKMMKREAVDNLITKEGKKGKGNHKGWKERLIKDFDSTVDDFYIQLDPPSMVRNEMKDAPWWQFEEDEDGWIKKWITETYGYSDQLYLEARRVGSLFWMEYLKARFSKTCGI